MCELKIIRIREKDLEIMNSFGSNHFITGVENVKMIGVSDRERVRGEISLQGRRKNK